VFDNRWKPHVSVADKKAKAEKAAEKLKKKGVTLSPVVGVRGSIATTFWGKAWCQNLEQYSDYSNRLPRGRTYICNGSVIDLQITKGAVSAQVVGTRRYRVEVRVSAVSKGQWQKIIKDCAGSIATLVELLQGRLSQAVMERICAPGTGLFPAANEISFSCSCPDWASICKHVAAVFYGIGVRLDTEPKLLFMLRQVDAQDLVAQVGGMATNSSQEVSSTKVLDTSLLADVFGLEMVESPPPVVKSKLAERTVKKKPVVKKAITEVPEKIPKPTTVVTKTKPIKKR
jgi:uncharacterized Zn finger protein